MNQRTLMSRCHNPGLNRRHGARRSVDEAEVGSSLMWLNVRGSRSRVWDTGFIVQQRTRFWARPASLVSLYLVLISRPVSARVLMVVSRSTRWREAISFVATM